MVILNSHVFPALGVENTFVSFSIMAAAGLVAMNYVFRTYELYVTMFVILSLFACQSQILATACTYVVYEDAGRLQGTFYTIYTIGGLIGTYGGYELYVATYQINYAAPFWFTLSGLSLMIAGFAYWAKLTPAKSQLQTSPQG